jgi:hypothetical protein
LAAVEEYSSVATKLPLLKKEKRANCAVVRLERIESEQIFPESLLHPPDLDLGKVNNSMMLPN